MQSTTWRNKTLRRNVDLSGNPGPWKGPTSEALDNFLNAEVNEAYKRPWHRLERGLRLNRLNLFAEEEKKRLGLSDQDSKDLYSLLVKSLDKKLLNSKSTVNYDPVKERILEIKGLVMHRNAEERVLFQIIERKTNSITFRKPRASSPPTGEPTKIDK
jgi:hypothetical protein